MTSFSAKALRTDSQGLAFLRAVLRGTTGSPAPIRRIMRVFVNRRIARPNDKRPADQLAAAER